MTRKVADTDYYQPLTEHQLKIEVLKIAYKNGWLVYHVPATNVRGSQGRGYPDLTLARDGKVLWLELKQEKAGQSNEQILWMFALGMAYHVIRPSDWSAGKVHELLQ